MSKVFVNPISGEAIQLPFDPAGIIGGMVYRGVLDASGGSYPSSPSKGDFYKISVAGTISGTVYKVSDFAAYNGSTWDRIDGAVFGYTPEDAANKSTNMTTDTGSDVKYPSVKAVETYVSSHSGSATVSNKTDDYNVLLTDFGKVLTMSNSATKTFFLPSDLSSVVGKTITFAKIGVGKTIVQANTGQSIAGSTSGGVVFDDAAAETFATVTLLVASASALLIVGIDGTWTVASSTS